MIHTSPTSVAPGGLLLHIGPHKTGTTTVQNAFVARREELAAHGVAYPGKSAAPHGAVIARLGTWSGWYDEIPPTSIRRWERFCALTRSLDTTVVVSSEALCHADDEQAAAVCDELRPGPVRVLITLRPLAALLPSSWQEYLKAGWTETYPEFLDWVLNRADEPDNPVRTFWTRQDHGRLVERWAAAVGPENVTVVISDPAQPRLLLDAVEDMAGLPRGLLATSTGAAVANRSLTWAECALVRHFNVVARRSMEWDTYNTVMRSGAFAQMVAAPPSSSTAERTGLPAWAARLAAHHGTTASERITATGVEVVGDLSTLSVETIDHGPTGDEPTMIPIDALVAAAAGIMSAVAPPRSRR